MEDITQILSFIFRMNKKKKLFRDVCIPFSIKRSSLKASASIGNDVICIFGDLDTNDVEIHSQKYTVSSKILDKFLYY